VVFNGWKENSKSNTPCFISDKGSYKKNGEGLFTRVDNDRTRGTSLKLKEDKCRLDIRRKFFTVRVVRHWNRFWREVVDAPSLEMFKARLDGALANVL